MPNPSLKIIIENKIPYIKGLLDPFATVSYLAPGEINPAAVADADALIVRTRTRCNAELLGRSKCKLVATATIGTDHIDKDFCRFKGVTVVNAPGCNAPAVAQYVFASLLHTINRPLSSYTIGIVGVGHVGSIVERWARALDMKVLLCDPPRQRAEGGDQWSTMEEIAERADIITLHTPLITAGQDKTYHLIDEAYLASLRRAPIIINSARGEIVDTRALTAARRAGLAGPLIIDCWENEPDIDLDLLEAAEIATPHIAGYSKAGKIRASQQALDAVTTFFSLPRVTVEEELPRPAPRSVTKKGLIDTFDPSSISESLRRDPQAFESLRNNYTLRPEPAEASED